MKKILALALVAVSGAAIAAAMPVHRTVAAANLGWYVGVGVNMNAVWTDRTFPAAGVNKLKSNRIGGEVFAGYRLTRYLGNELGFVYMGQRRYEVGTAAANVTAKIKNQWAVYYDGLIFLPLYRNMLEAFAKVGVDYYQKTGDTPAMGTATTAGPQGILNNRKLKTIGANFGFGLQFNYMQFAARLTYTDYNHYLPGLQNNTAATAAPNLIALDVLYRFG